MLNRISVSLPHDIENEVRAALADWASGKLVDRLWDKDASLWSSDDESKWLGWLSVIDNELADLDKYRKFEADLISSEFKHVLLMGMGGSSLCPEVLGTTFAKGDFHILDSTVPARIREIEDLIDIQSTLFIVASKSGSTLEPNCFKQYFFEKLSARIGKDNAGKQFVAITDPGSKMEQVAKDDGFRYIFYGDPEIGGRFSALSAFGLTAAAAMALDVEILLNRAKEMARACRSNKDNPGLLLGVILGICHAHSRDKLTIFADNEIFDLGAWLEQLIAESTGKKGIAIIPVDREPIQAADRYSNDRVFVSLTLKGGKTQNDRYQTLQALERSGHPFVSIELDTTYDLAQEFFRWEFATAVAGSIMKINPFNQPDVEAAKIEARKLTDEYEQNGSLPEEIPFYSDDVFKMFSSKSIASKLVHGSEERTASAILTSHLKSIENGDYFALLAYVEMSTENEALLQRIRAKVLEKYRIATCLGFGPRFLHSTGQAYKGGSDNGVFLQVTSDDAFDLPVPGQQYSFGTVKAAQARGDFQVLLDRGRRALRIHLGSDVKVGLEKLAAIV